MTNEIKLLENILFRLDCNSPISKKYGLELNKNECKLLLDYITNLQKDLENYVNVVLHNRKVIDNLQQRIDKANQLIEKQKKKMYKSRNKIAMYVLMNIEKELKEEGNKDE